MSPFPYQKITIVTNLSKNEILDRFRKCVGNKQYKNWNRIDRNLFTGSRVNDNFEMELLTDYRNSFTPVIKGTLFEIPEGTALEAVLRSNWPVTIATLVFITIGLILSALELAAYVKNEPWSFWYFPGFVLFPYGLWWIAFNVDASKAIDALLKISQGTVKANVKDR